MKITLFIIAFILNVSSLFCQEEKVLNVAVFNSAPFCEHYSDGAYGGLMVDLWEDIAKRNNYQYKYYDETVQGLLTGIESGKYDVGLGALPITPKREKYVDFSHAVNHSGIGYAMAKDNNILSKNSIYQLVISLLELLAGLLVLLLLSGIVVWWAERKHTRDNPDSGISSIYDALWWSAVTMTTVGYGDKVPKSAIGKFLGIIWIFASILLLSLFTANASAILSQDHHVLDINSVTDLRSLKVGSAIKSAGEELLHDEHIDHETYKDIYIALDALVEGEIECVVNNAPVLYYIIRHDKKYMDRLVIGEHLLVKNNMGIALQHNSPIEEEVNVAILELINEPKWHYEFHKYFEDFDD